MVIGGGAQATAANTPCSRTARMHHPVCDRCSGRGVMQSRYLHMFPASACKLSIDDFVSLSDKACLQSF